MGQCTPRQFEEEPVSCSHLDNEEAELREQKWKEYQRRKWLQEEPLESTSSNAVWGNVTTERETSFECDADINIVKLECADSKVSVEEIGGGMIRESGEQQHYDLDGLSYSHTETLTSFERDGSLSHGRQESFDVPLGLTEMESEAWCKLQQEEREVLALLEEKNRTNRILAWTWITEALIYNFNVSGLMYHMLFYQYQNKEEVMLLPEVQVAYQEVAQAMLNVIDEALREEIIEMALEDYHSKDLAIKQIKKKISIHREKLAIIAKHTDVFDERWIHTLGGFDMHNCGYVDEDAWFSQLQHIFFSELSSMPGPEIIRNQIRKLNQYWFSK